MRRCLIAILCFVVGPILAGPIRRPAERALFPIKDNDQFGYIDRKGTVVIAPHYDEARSFSEGMVGIRIDYNRG